MGRVVFIGAGPGSADLITVRGAQRLAHADVVLFDALTDPALRVYAPQAHWIDVGKRGAAPHAAPDAERSTEQDAINACLVEQAEAHAVVVRLKGGDPGVFGRLEEELEALAAAGIECEIVPGVTAALAAAADAQRPLTRRGRGRSAALATAMTREGRIEAGRSADTEVYYMAGRRLGALARRLAVAGWSPDAPVLVVSRAGWPDALVSEHRVDTLAQATVLHAGRPTVVTVGAGAARIEAAAKAPRLAASAPKHAMPVPAASAPAGEAVHSL